MQYMQEDLCKWYFTHSKGNSTNFIFEHFRKAKTIKILHNPITTVFKKSLLTFSELPSIKLIWITKIFAVAEHVDAIDERTVGLL
jgi:hypothetical protein